MPKDNVRKRPFSVNDPHAHAGLTVGHCKNSGILRHCKTIPAFCCLVDGEMLRGGRSADKI